VTAGGPAFVLTVNGSNYVSSSVVQFNGSPRSTVQLSATQVQGTITAADIAAGAQNTITVANPAGQGDKAELLEVSDSPSTIRFRRFPA